MNSMRDFIWRRQYAVRPNETYNQGLWRVVDAVAKTPEDAERYYDLMVENRFIPGGRILAGAGSSHGNLINCYVQDGDHDDPTERTMHLALKLALTTKVGGGNGLNLDYLPAKDRLVLKTGKLAITDERPDVAEDLLTGTFTDQVTGQRKAHQYRRAAVYVGGGDIPFVVDRWITPEDSIEGIWQAAWEMTEELLLGKNVLIDLSELRREGEPVKGSGGTSSGPVSFAIEVFDNFAHWASLGGGELAGPVAALRYVFAPTLRVIKQAGVRRGAGMATLSIDHKDIEDFITAKDLEREQAEGDISTFNISVLAPDIAMLKGSDALDLIAERAHATGEPGLLFVDTINEHNPLLDLDGPILATNPCGEQPLYPAETCNLGAINLARHITKFGTVDWDLLERTTRTAVDFLDDVLDAHKSPLPDIAESVERKRRIGLGVMGLADALIARHLDYRDHEARVAAAEMVSFITDRAIDQSVERARKLGVPVDVERAGLFRRNIALMTVAPTGTTSMLAGVSSGIEPNFSRTYQRRVGNEMKTVTHPWASSPVFVTAHDISPTEHVLMQAAIQNAIDYLQDTMYKTWVGSSISKTINLPHDATVEDVHYAFQLAWSEGCKGITVYRDGSRDMQVLTEAEEKPKALVKDLGTPEAVAVLEKLSNIDDGLLEDAMRDTYEPSNTDYAQLQVLGEASSRPVRGETTYGRTYKYEVSGRKVYVTINRNGNNELVEVFVNMGRPTDQERTAADIIGRLLSLSLKHGAPVQDVVNHLSGHQDQTGGFVPGEGFFTSIWEAVAKALQEETEVRPDTSHLRPVCPDCGTELVFQEGCHKCYSCGYSACA